MGPSLDRVRKSVLCLTLALAAAAPAFGQLVADFSTSATTGPIAHTVSFTNLAPTGPGFTQLWQFGDGNVSSADHPVHQYTEPGTYSVTLFVTKVSPFETDIEVKVDLIVAQPVTIAADFTASVLQGNQPLQVNFTDTSSGANLTSWDWDFGDGNSSTLQHPTHTYQFVAAPTLYTVSLVANAGSTTDTVVKSEFITVLPKALGLKQIFSLTIEELWAISAADLDSDGDLDALCTSRDDDTVAWYENIDGLGSFGPEKVISTAADDARGVDAADLDGDGDMDLLSASFNDGKLAWYRNTNGLGSFVEQPPISIDPMGAHEVLARDVDGDGDMDVIATFESDLSVGWFENTDGLGTFGPLNLIAGFFEGAGALAVADMDGDADLDVLFLTANLHWAENLDGAGSFGPAQTVLAVPIFANDVHTDDMDMDGDTDVLIAHFANDTVIWYPNSDGLGNLGLGQLVTDQAFGVRATHTADIDGDGDPDVLAASYLDGSFTWYENTDGQGGFGPEQVIGGGGGQPRAIVAADFDGDGDPDVLTGASGLDILAWHENSFVEAPWVHLGGNAGSTNHQPVLRPLFGSLAPGSLLTLDLKGAPPSTALLAWLSFASTPLDIFNGTLFANPPSAQFLRFSDPSGVWTQSLTWPNNIPVGTEFWLQFLVQDASVPAGITLTNGLKAITP